MKPGDRVTIENGPSDLVGICTKDLGERREVKWSDGDTSYERWPYHHLIITPGDPEED